VSDVVQQQHLGHVHVAALSSHAPAKLRDSITSSSRSLSHTCVRVRVCVFVYVCAYICQCECVRVCAKLYLHACGSAHACNRVSSYISGSLAAYVVNV